MNIETQEWGKLPNNHIITVYYLNNNNGVKVSVLDYGARWLQVEAPDVDNNIAALLLGTDKILENNAGSPFLHLLTPDDGLIEADLGFTHWHANTFIEDKAVSVQFDTPLIWENKVLGHIVHTYKFNHENQLFIETEIQCAQDSFLSAGQMPYFNLAPDTDNTIGAHTLMIHAYKYMTPVEALPPSQTSGYVLGTPWNLSRGNTLQHLIDSYPTQSFAARYISNKEPERWGAIGKCLHAKNGRVIELVSNQPTLYIGSLSAPLHHALCLSPQAFPLNGTVQNKVFCAAGQSYTFRSRYTFTTTAAGHKH